MDGKQAPVAGARPAACGTVDDELHPQHFNKKPWGHGVESGEKNDGNCMNLSLFVVCECVNHPCSVANHFDLYSLYPHLAQVFFHQ